MIAAPIAYCEADNQLVAAFDALARGDKAPGYWADDILAGLKTRVKAYYITAQSSRCCYCDRHQGTENHRSWDVEHIADRSKYPWFMFTPKNLAAACPDCNVAKSDKEALVTAGRKTYPADSAGFRLVHPHFDSFADHILRLDLVYIPKTKKGKYTIIACDLLRFAEKYIAWENSAADTRFEAEVNAAFQHSGAAGLAAVAEAIAKLPKSTD
ncbi:HNH endonuclease [Sphingomonas sp. Xoc002]|uniref:HNH endonuclease n=1 Tax=Sphingomonas sp. Xoc002 TaxID=2837624 RepID=UPI003D176C59